MYSCTTSFYVGIFCLWNDQSITQVIISRKPFDTLSTECLRWSQCIGTDIVVGIHPSSIANRFVKCYFISFSCTDDIGSCFGRIGRIVGCYYDTSTLYHRNERNNNQEYKEFHVSKCQNSSRKFTRRMSF